MFDLNFLTVLLANSSYTIASTFCVILYNIALKTTYRNNNPYPTDHVMDIPKFDDLIQQIKTKLWLTGISYERPQILIRFYICATILATVTLQEVIFLMLYASPENFLEITQVLPCTCTSLITFIKIGSLFKKKKELNELTNHLQKLFKNILKEEKMRLIVKDKMVFLKKLIKGQTVLNLALVCVFNLASLFIMLYVYLSKRELIFDLPFSVAMPCDVDWWLPWLVEYLMSATASLFCVLLFITFDSTYFLLSTNVFINFTVLSESFRKINETTSEESIKNIIRSHQHIIRLSEILEDIFNVPNFANVIFGSLQICFLGFTIMMGSWVQIPQSIFLLSSILLQLLMMSYFGENIITESRRVGEAAYQCNWCNMDERSKKTIHIVILRSQRPQYLTALNFSKISYANFTTIISKSFSYFSILRTIYAQK